MSSHPAAHENVDIALATAAAPVTATSRISVEEVHFGHFFYGGLQIAKMRSR